MSSLTTISSGMEESLDFEEHVDTRLSLSLVIGAGSRPSAPVQVQAQALLPASPPPETEPAAAACRKRKGPETGRAGSTAITRQQGKRDRGIKAPTGGDARKKLRLTGEQAAIMEKSFRAHNVLSHNDLARQLGLKPRQVEVWFQNRRARTKLKQTELDCELLRRWCERLSDNNARLRREVAEARSSSSTAFLSRLTSAATINASCLSCNKPAGCWPGVGLGLINRD